MKLETFFEKFEVLAEMPGAVGKLREMICELAVRGKLVPQVQSDEPAVALLSNIRDAKAALALKQRGTGDAEAGDQDSSPPYSAPIGWIWTILGEVQVFTNGYAFKSEDYQSSGVGIIRMGELGANGEIDETGMKFVSDSLAQSLPVNFRVKTGDLLMGMSGSIGKLAINRSGKTYLLNQRVGRLEPILIEKEFLHLFLKTVEQRYLEISFGMAIKNLSTKQINETPFPLPPLAEQKRIVAKVDELMALCDRLEAQQQERETRHTALARASLGQFADAPTPANLQFLFHPSYAIVPADLRKSILTLAVQGKLVPQDPDDESAEDLLRRNDERRRETARNDHRADEESQPLLSGDDRWDIADTWSWRGLADLVLFVDYRGKTPAKLSSGVRLLTAKNVRKGQINLSPEEFLSENEYHAWMTRGLPKAGDVLFTTEAPMGNAAVVELTERFALAQRVICFQSYGALDPAFLVLQILSDQFQFILDKNGTGVTAKGIKASKLKQLPIAIPPLAEQRQIVAKVTRLFAFASELEVQLAVSRTLAQSTLAALGDQFGIEA